MGKPTGLAKEQDRALEQLTTILDTRLFYLAGGSAVALHLGHRISNDVDLFSASDKVNLQSLRRRITTKARAEVVSLSDASLRLVLESASVDIVKYPYPLLEPPRSGPHGFPVAGLRDLAAMKLATIAGRGLRRDFWDLFEINRKAIPLAEAVESYLARFGLGEPDVYHLARALTYFVDAERDPLFPLGLTQTKWERIKSFFRKEAPTLLTKPAPGATSRKSHKTP